MVVAKSIRQRIVETIETRLQAIHGDEFQTNAGHRVFLGVDAELSTEDDLDHPEDSAAIQISVGDDEPDHHMERVQRTMPVVISSVALATYRKPWAAIEATLADIQRAMELEDRTLGGLVPSDIDEGLIRTRERESGSEVVGSEITYTVIYSHQWGQPDEL